MRKHKHITKLGIEWDVYDQLPEGWEVVSKCAPHIKNYAFIRPKDWLKAGGKSGRISLLREQPASPFQPKPVQPKQSKPKPKAEQGGLF